MARLIKLTTREMGDLNVMLVRCVQGRWEAAWEALQTSPYGQFVTVVPQQVIDHALLGWTSPLVKALGPAPNLILHRLSPDSKQCSQREGCLFYRKQDCLPKAPKMPSCFELAGLPADISYELLRLWRESVYMVAVEET